MSLSTVYRQKSDQRAQRYLRQAAVMQQRRTMRRRRPTPRPVPRGY
jgi:hypothetical protein